MGFMAGCFCHFAGGCSASCGDGVHEVSDLLGGGRGAEDGEYVFAGAVETELITHDGCEVVGGEFVSLEGVTEAVECFFLWGPCGVGYGFTAGVGCEVVVDGDEFLLCEAGEGVD